jgi:hypothetical protein
MRTLNIIQEPKVLAFVTVRVIGSDFTRYGVITKVTPDWIYLEGARNTRSGWVKRSNLVDCYTPSSLPTFAPWDKL